MNLQSGGNALQSDWRELERMGMDAFPAIVTEHRMGSVFRAAGGLNYRNSSVTLLDPEESPLDALLAETVSFSKAHGIEPVLRVPRLWPHLESELVDRGWEMFREAAVYDRRLRAPADPDPSLIPDVSFTRWLEFQLENRDLSSEARQTLRQIFQLIPERAARPLWHPADASAPLAGAMLWFDGSHCALMNMLVTASARGKGVGRAFLAALFGHAAHQGASVMWLQVHKQNTPAVNLYTRAGFSLVYDYAYWRPRNGL